MAFGRRNDAMEHPLRTKNARAPTRFGRWWPYLTLLIYFPVACLAFVKWENSLPFPRDLNPGYQIDEGAFEQSAGCPNRSWAVGEFLPRECTRDYRFTISPPRLGLESMPSSRGLLRRHPMYWVRQHGDALGVTCPGLVGCRIDTVVRSRFVDDGPTVGSPASTFDYRTPTLGFRISFWVYALMSVAPFSILWLAGLSAISSRLDPLAIAASAE